MTLDLAGWTPTEQRVEDVISPARVAAWYATLDHRQPEVNAGQVVPPGFHWTLGQPAARQSDLGDDGHARLGAFFPPIGLPRRMWAGSRIQFLEPLRVSDAVERRSLVLKVQEKRGATGALVFVTVRHQLSGPRGLAVEEEQDLVYREPPRPGTDAPAARDERNADRTRTVTPTETMLFRFSALTFNGHRIHYDRRYTTEVEGYPGLVVHGPLMATLLLDSLPRDESERVERFQFRAVRPAFDGAPIQLHVAADGAERRLWATNERGEIAVESTAMLRDDRA